MSTLAALLRRHQTAASVTILAALAYLPALSAAPGRMPADSKLYVYLDPARFISDTTTTFDPRLYAGWVPHQHIAYLWPTGPWFWFFETIGVPDWVAHRLWIGTLLLAAGTGVFWMCRRFGFVPTAALAAALVYQLSPYVLPYISRTSVLLLPFAGLGWIVGCTALAAQRGRWRYSALVALIVLTVGAVNATALAMIIPAPVLWLVHAAWSRSISWRRATETAAKIAVASTVVSLWWIAMLSIQGRYGAEVLAYSESLESVSFTSTATEVGRGLGYWLFYVRDGFAATTTASIDHLISVPVVVAGFVLGGLCLTSIVVVRSPLRRFAALLAASGVVLGVGVHPIDDPSPLMNLLVGDGQGGLALALRSSTRAVPVLLLALAIGAASLVTAATDARRWAPRLPAAGLRVAAVGGVAVLALVNLPALRSGGFVDPALERDQDPPAHWTEAAAALDAREPGSRVLQVPGTEFGAFAWGYTVDQPLPSLTDRALVTRDLLPLGSAAAMDLAFALDDRIQEGTFEPTSLAPIARLLGVDTVWVAGDVSFDRFASARPDVFTAQVTSPGVIGLGASTPYGPVAPVVTDVSMIDAESIGDPRAGRPIAPVTLVDIADAMPTTRLKDGTVLLAGSGDGIIDAAAAGLIDGSEAILYAASPVADDLADVPVDRLVVTDSNRRRAHHWRSSQDVYGYTESAEVDAGVLRFQPADQRLPVFPPEGVGEAADAQTVSIQRGVVTAQASAYGEPFAYRPEHRPVMAVDGDLATSWLVADRAPAIGEFIELTSAEPIEYLDLRQPDPMPDARTIERVTVTVDGVDQADVVLTEESLQGVGQRVDLSDSTAARDGAVVRITIAGVTAPQPPVADAIGAVGFAEIGTGHDPTVEWIRPPLVDGAVAESVRASGAAVDLVFSRLRTAPNDRWRDDPEPVLRREFELPVGIDAELGVTLRFDQRAAGDLLADALGEPVIDRGRLTGTLSARGAAAFDGDSASAWITPFITPTGNSVMYLGDGTASRLSILQPAGDFSPVTAVRIVDADGVLDLPVAAGELELPRPIDLTDVTIQISEVDPRLTVDRRYAEPFVLPAAISEIHFDGESPGVAPVERLEFACRDDLLFIDGAGVPIRWSADVGTILAGDPIEAEPCLPEFSWSAGLHRIEAAPAAATGFHVDRVVARSMGAAEVASTVLVDPTRDVLVDSGRRHRTIDVPPCPGGCWVIVGEGYNSAWSASVDGVDLGAPTLVDGNANGWWLPPSDAGRTVEARWTAQRTLTIALWLSAIGALCLVGLVVWDRRRPDDADLILPEGRVAAKIDTERDQSGAVSRSAWATVAVGSIGAGILVGWVWIPVVAAVSSFAVLFRRPWLTGAVGCAVIAASGAIVSVVVARERPFPNAGWPVRFEYLHEWTLVGFVMVALGTVLSETRVPREP